MCHSSANSQEMELPSEYLLQLTMEINYQAFIWIEACIVQSGKNLEGNSIMIDWFAFQGSQSGVSHGQAIFSLTTIGSHCNRVKFTQAWIIKA